MTSNSYVDVNLIYKLMAQKFQGSLLKIKYLDTERFFNNNHSSYDVFVDSLIFSIRIWCKNHNMAIFKIASYKSSGLLYISHWTWRLSGWYIPTAANIGCNINIAILWFLYLYIYSGTPKIQVSYVITMLSILQYYSSL